MLCPTTKIALKVAVVSVASFISDFGTKWPSWKETLDLVCTIKIAHNNKIWDNFVSTWSTWTWRWRTPCRWWRGCRGSPRWCPHGPGLRQPRRGTPASGSPWASTILAHTWTFLHRCGMLPRCVSLLATTHRLAWRGAGWAAWRWRGGGAPPGGPAPCPAPASWRGLEWGDPELELTHDNTSSAQITTPQLSNCKKCSIRAHSNNSFTFFEQNCSTNQLKFK